MFILFSLTSQAQLGGVLKKAKDKVNSTEKASKPINSPNENIPIVSEKAKEATPKPDVATNGISSPSHQKYLNKIVFASEDASIKMGSEDETKFINKAVLGNPIFFRVYMDNSLDNYLKNQSFANTHGRYKIKFYLNGDDIYTTFLTASEFTSSEKELWTTWRGALKSSNNSNYLGIYEFNNFLRKAEDKLMTGEHQFKMEIMPYTDYPKEYTGPVIASGELILTVKGTAVDPHDTKLCMPKALMNDKNLESKIVAAFKNQGWDRDGKETRITSQKWNIERNQVTGVITRRFVEAAVGFSKDGKCAFENYNFYQDYDGKDYQPEVHLEGIGTKYDISCKCLKP